MENNKSNAGKFTLITGASSGIGLALSAECAIRKNNLVMVSLPDKTLKRAALYFEKKYGIIAHVFEIDLTEKDAPQHVKSFTEKNNIKINFLINNAGIGVDGVVGNYTQKNIDDIIFLNIRALTSLTNLFINELKNQESSYILNVSSFASYIPIAYKSIYVASKSYVYFFTESLRAEMEESNVKVSALLPGGVRTNKVMCEKVIRNGYFSRISSLYAEEVASYAIKKLQNGRQVIVPGKINNFIYAVFSILPYFVCKNILKQVFTKSVKTEKIKYSSEISNPEFQTSGRLLLHPLPRELC